jgi:hypothetical protein
MRKIITNRKKETFIKGDEYSFEHFLTTLLTEHYDIKSKRELSRIINNICKTTDGNCFRNDFCSIFSPVELYYNVIYGYWTIQDLIISWEMNTDEFEKEFLFIHRRNTRIDVVLEN